MKKKQKHVLIGLGALIALGAAGMVTTFIGGRELQKQYINEAKTTMSDIKNPEELEAFKKEARIWISGHNAWVPGVIATCAFTFLVFLAVIVYVCKELKKNREEWYYDEEQNRIVYNFYR